MARYGKGSFKGISVELVGTKELEKAFKDMEADMRNRLAENAASKAGDMVVQDAKALAPVDTEALRDSIGKEIKRGKRGSFVQVGSTIGDTSQAHGYYAFFIEYGTSKMAPKPFLRPALDKNRNTIMQIFTREIMSAVEKVSA